MPMTSSDLTKTLTKPPLATTKPHSNLLHDMGQGFHALTTTIAGGGNKKELSKQPQLLNGKQITQAGEQRGTKRTTRRSEHT